MTGIHSACFEADAAGGSPFPAILEIIRGMTGAAWVALQSPHPLGRSPGNVSVGTRPDVTAGGDDACGEEQFPLVHGGKLLAHLVTAGARPEATDPARMAPVLAALAQALAMTRRREREGASRERLLNQRRMLDNAEAIVKCGSWEWDPVTGRMHLSREMARILGLEPVDDAVPVDRLRDVFPPSSRRAIQEAYASLSRGEAAADVGVPIRTKQGLDRRVRILAEAKRDGEALTSIHGTIQDVTDAIEAEALLASASTFKGFITELTRHVRDYFAHKVDAVGLFRRLTEMASLRLDVPRVGLWLVQGEREGGRVIRCVDLFVRGEGHASGHELSERDHPVYFAALGRNVVLNAPHARDDDWTAEFLRTYLLPHDIHSLLDAPFEVRGRVAGIICFEQTGAPRAWTTDEEGCIIALCNALANVAGHWDLEATVAARTQDLEASRAELREERARLEAIVTNSPDYIMEVGRDLRVLYLNTTREGLDRRVFFGMPVLDYMSRLDAEKARAAIMETFHSGKPTMYEARFLYESVELEVRCRVRAVKVAGVVDRVIITVTDLTHERDFEAKLRQAQEEANWFRYAIDQAGAVSVISANSRMQQVNETYCRLTGYSAEELLGQDFTLLRSGLHDDAFYRNVWDTLAAGRVWRSEVSQRAKDGSLFWMDLTIVPLLGPEDKPIRYIGMGKDVTARKHAEERFRVIFEQSATPHVLSDETGLVDCNAALLRLLGLSGKDEVIGRRASDFAAPFQPDGVPATVKAQEMNRLAREHGHHRFDWVLRDKAGRDVPVEISLSAVRLHGKQMLLAHCYDMTERKAAELALRRSHEELEERNHFISAITNNVPQSIYVYSLAGYTRYVNEFARQLFGMGEGGPTGSDVDSTVGICHPDDQEAIRKRLASMVTWEDGSRHEIIYRSKARTGEWRWFSDVATVFRRDADGRVIEVLGVCSDITEKTLAIERLEQERARTFNAAKMASLGEMAGGIAHEINNPLAIIQGAARRIRRRVLATAPAEPAAAGALRSPVPLAADSDALAAVEMIEATTMRIAKIVKGLRSIARDGEGDPYAFVPVASLLEDALALCRERFHSHGIPLTADPGPAGLSVECQAVQLAQVLLNLINNAFDAVEPLAEKWVKVTAEPTADGGVAIAVTDSGFGIPRELAQKIMQPFYTTKPLGKGTGLGLSISRGIVESHGGVLIYDEASPRTRFVVTLPRNPSRAKARSP